MPTEHQYTQSGSPDTPAHTNFAISVQSQRELMDHTSAHAT